MKASEMNMSERFEHLYSEYAPAVIKYIRRRVDKNDVEELAAEVFVVAWRKLKVVEVGNELPWLYRTASLIIANRRRRHKSLPFSSIFTNDDNRDNDGDKINEKNVKSVDSTQDKVINKIDAVRVINALSNEDREILFLTALEGCTNKMIAEILECSEVSARKRLSRARASLLDAMTNDQDENTNNHIARLEK